MKTAHCSIWRWLEIVPGTMADYEELKHFHYRSGRPGGVMRVFAARYRGPGLGGKDAHRGLVAGVAVESLPALACALRTLALPGRFNCGDRRLAAAQLNRDMRTISRVVVHPMFRSTGLAVELVKHILAHAQTPYIEALAAMGRVHPFFKRAGMSLFDRPPLPAAVRLIAALQHENLRPIDLVDTARLPETPFLLAELRRFSSKKHANFTELATEARAKLLSQPVYFVWENPAKQPYREDANGGPGRGRSF
ncbi:MAG: hypothetical protein FWD61_17385 [Phycisphaerales bacterium]|nr:hypothetical protein [Phycisphaerales bacterium]